MAEKEKKQKELKKPSRIDLLQLLISQTRENERLSALMVKANEKQGKGIDVPDTGKGMDVRDTGKGLIDETSERKADKNGRNESNVAWISTW